MRKILFALSLLVAPPLHAQWSPLPNGNFAYTFAYTSSATFSCEAPLLPSSCLANGNSISFFNGTANATLSFTGVSKTVTVPRGGIRLPGFEIGTFNLAFGGVGAFEWPATKGPQQTLFAVHIAMTETSPLVSNAIANRHFRPRSPTEIVNDCCDGDGTSIEWRVTPPPSGAPAAIIVDSFMPLVFNVGGLSTLVVTASIGIVPEPSTWAMLFVGLMGVGLVRRRRA